MSDALDLLASLVLEDGRRWGDAATPVQWADSHRILDPAPGDPRLGLVERSKGFSKTTDLSGCGISWLLTQAPPLAEGYIVGADSEQGNRLLDRARGLISRTPGLASLLDVQARQIVNRRTGARLLVLAADVPGSEGILAHMFFVDEGARWANTRTARGMWTSIVSAVPKVPGCRLVAIGHAGDPAHWFHKVRERARTSPNWWHSSVDGPAPWLDAADLAEQEHMLLPSEFARRFLNRWTSGEDRLTSKDDLAACVGTHDVLAPDPAVTRYVIGLDIGLTNDRTVATVAHKDAQGRVVADRQAVWEGTPAKPVQLDQVTEWLREASRDYHRALVVFDPYQAIHAAQLLTAAGVPTRKFNFSSQSVGQLAVTLFRLIRDHLLLLPADDALVDEILNARLRETAPGVFRIDHDSDRHDDRVISLALAAHELAKTATPTPANARGVQTFANSTLTRPAPTPDGQKARASRPAPFLDGRVDGSAGVRTPFAPRPDPRKVSGRFAPWRMKPTTPTPTPPQPPEPEPQEVP